MIRLASTAARTIAFTTWNPSSEQAGHWIKSNPTDAAKVLGPLWGNLKVTTVETANRHRIYEVEPVSTDRLGEQQKIADAFLAAGLLPRAIDTRDVGTWKP